MKQVLFKTIPLQQLIEKAFNYADKFLDKSFEFAKMELEQFSPFPHTTMEYWVGGKGKPLLLLHGFCDVVTFQWLLQIQHLARHYRVIVPSMIYFGGSTSSSGDYSIEFQVDCLNQLLDHLKLEDVALAGLSYGGIVAMFFADRYPKRINKAVVTGAPLKGYSKADQAKTLEHFKIDDIYELILPSKASGISRLFKMIYHLKIWVPEITSKVILKEFYHNQRAEKRKLIKYIIDGEDELVNREYCLDCKMLLLWGQHDYLFPTSVGQDIVQYYGKDLVKMHTIKRTAHMPNMERPLTYNKLLVDFLED